jgi:HEAT repeat protein
MGLSTGQITINTVAVLASQREIGALLGQLPDPAAARPGEQFDAYQQIAAGLGRANIALDVDAQGQLRLEPDQPPAVDLRPFEALLRDLRLAIQGGHAPPGPAELEARRTRYLQLVVAQCQHLRLEGLSTGTRPIVLALEDVYVQLRAVAEVPETADAFSPEERRLLRLLEQRQAPDPDLREAHLRLDAIRRERWTRERLERFPIAQALADPHRRGLVILGDPGSGKSTLLQFLALVFAQGPEAAERQLQVRGPDAARLPILAPLASYDDMLDKQPDLDIQAFLARYYDRRRTAPGLGPVFDAAIAEGRALILLDGLDEVIEERRRRYVAEQATRFVQAALARGNRVVLTSRVYGYRAAPLAADLPHITVLDFRQEEIAAFARQWFRALLAWERGGAPDAQSELLAQQEERRLLDDIRSNPGVERLAVNPLLLTMLALLRRQVGSLPQRRIKLYDLYVSALIESWEENRSRGARLHGGPLRTDPQEAEGALIELALWLQQHRPSGTATAGDLLERLRDFYLREDHGLDPASPVPRPQAKQAEERARRFLHDMRHHSGLLIERGQGAFGFRHLTFQEYFAGRALARMPAAERWALLQPNLHSGRWREPLLLCAARLGVAESRAPEATELVERILAAASRYEPLLRRDLLLAADCAADDIGLPLALLQQLADDLWALLDTRVPALGKAALQRLYRLWQLRAGEQARLPELEGRLLEWLLEEAANYERFRDEAHDLLRRMARDDGAEVPDFLRRHLTNAPWNVRVAAIGALTELVASDASVRDALQNALSDPNEYVRMAAIQALAALVSSESAIRDTLQNSLADPDNNMRVAAIRALAPLALSEPAICDALQNALSDASRNVRAAAVRALAPLASSQPDICLTLQKALIEPDNGMRVAAIEALAPLASSQPDICLTLQKALIEPDNGMRVAAVRALAPLASSQPAIHLALQKAIADPDRDVRAAAVLALAPLASSQPDICLTLQKALADTSEYVRATTLGVLAPLISKDRRLATRFAEVQTHRDWRTRREHLPYITDQTELRNCSENRCCQEASSTQATIIIILSSYSLENQPVQLTLRSALADPYPDVRAAAIEALAPLASSQPDILFALQKALADPDNDVQGAAIEALAPLVPVNQDTHAALLAAITNPYDNLSETAFRVLATLALTDPDIRTTFQNAFADTDDSPPQNSWKTTIAILATLAPADANIYNALLTTLVEPDKDMWDAAIAALTTRTPSDPDIYATLFTTFLISLTELDNEHAAAIVPLTLLASANLDIRVTLQKALAAPYSDVRVVAVNTLAPLAPSQPVIRNALQNALADASWNVRMEAVHALAPLVALDPSIGEALLQALTDPEWNVRAAAIEALGALPVPEPAIRDTLLQALADPEWNVRAAAVQALGTLATSDPAIRDALLQALADPEWNVRAAAVRALGAQAASAPAIRDALLQALADPEWNVRAAAIGALIPLIPVDSALYARLLGAVGREDATRAAYIMGQDEFNQMLRQLATTYGQIVRDDPQRRAEVIAMLGDADWRRRKAAAEILREAGREAVLEAMPQLLAALEDTRGYDSWPARIAAAERLLNDDRHGEYALGLIQEALTYGADALLPIPGADEVRQQAALALGKLKALHHRADVAERIAGLLESEREPRALDGLYAALGSLAEAPELD